MHDNRNDEIISQQEINQPTKGHALDFKSFPKY